eukprot:766461-Hanusia_phi.AAC.1
MDLTMWLLWCGAPGHLGDAVVARDDEDDDDDDDDDDYDDYDDYDDDVVVVVEARYQNFTSPE